MPSGMSLLVVVLSGCADWSPRPAPAAAGLLGEIGAVNGVWKDAESQSTWETVVMQNRVHAIREQIKLYGSLSGTRLYEFDTTGALRHFSERLMPVMRDSALSDSAQIDSASRAIAISDSASGANIRESTIHFIVGEPALATRRYGGRPVGFGRREMFAIQTRGYAMMDSAIRYSARLKVRQATPR